MTIAELILYLKQFKPNVEVCYGLYDKDLNRFSSKALNFVEKINGFEVPWLLVVAEEDAVTFYNKKNRDAEMIHRMYDDTHQYNEIPGWCNCEDRNKI